MAESADRTPAVSPAPVAATAGQTAPVSALRRPRCHLLLWSCAALGLLADLWTKQWAFSSLGSQESRPFLGGLITLERSLNDGALFGLGKGMAPVFIAASFLALFFVLYLFTQSAPDRRSLHVGLAFILAGALGNLYDRAFAVADVITYRSPGSKEPSRIIGRILAQNSRSTTVGQWPGGEEPHYRLPDEMIVKTDDHGVVRDFIRIAPHVGKYPVWPWVFNIADVLLVVGVALLLVNFWQDRKAARNNAILLTREAPTSQPEPMPSP